LDRKKSCQMRFHWVVIIHTLSLEVSLYVVMCIKGRIDRTYLKVRLILISNKPTPQITPYCGQNFFELLAQTVYRRTFIWMRRKSATTNWLFLTSTAHKQLEGVSFSLMGNICTWKVLILYCKNIPSQSLKSNYF
jgi:hypothetical protein